MSIMYPELAETDEDEDDWDVASSNASRSDAKRTVQNILRLHSVAPDFDRIHPRVMTYHINNVSTIL
ncbi:MAG: hypothetical protein ACLR0U_04945 [Enterocloster clostridioformis]